MLTHLKIQTDTIWCNNHENSTKLNCFTLLNILYDVPTDTINYTIVHWHNLFITILVQMPVLWTYFPT